MNNLSMSINYNNGDNELEVRTFDEDHQMSIGVKAGRHIEIQWYSLGLEEVEQLVEFLQAHVVNEKEVQSAQF